MTLEPTTWASIVAAGSPIVSLIGLYILFQIRQDKTIAILSAKVDTLAETVAGVKTILMVQAQQTMRLDQHEKLIDELRHGEGYVLPLVSRKSAFGGEG